MITVEPVDPGSRSHVRRFILLPYRLYAGDPRWVPPLRRDVAEWFAPAVHPFYEHSEAAFFLAVRDGRDVGRIAVLEHRPYNRCHGVVDASFYGFECEDDLEAARALVSRAADWARSRGLARLIGPKGFSALDGYGVLVDGFAHRQLMTMSHYNPAWYARLLEAQGFRKALDFVSWQLDKAGYEVPARVRHVADATARRGTLRVLTFRSRRALVGAAQEIGAAYNAAFVQNWEYYPLTPREVAYLLGQLLVVADHRLIKAVAHRDRIVGFLFAFPDLSAALQRARGRLSPLALADLLVEGWRTRRIALNGAGILPEFQRKGGNALLYTEIERTIRTSRFEHAELPQVADTALEMRRDLATLGARPIKTHRVYTMGL